MLRISVIGFFYTLSSLINCIECYYDFPRSNSLNCTDLIPQKVISLQEAMGTWYGYELFVHQTNVNNEVSLNPCVVIQLSDVTYETATEQAAQIDTGYEEYHNRQVFHYDLPKQQPYGSQYFHYLRLVWSEQQTNLEYTLRYNTSRPGLWFSAAPQRGTMQKLNLGYFDGTIQALKVAENHLLLTFCIDHLFSIVLTREPKVIATEDIQSVRILLNHRELSVVSGLRECNDSTTIQCMSINVFLAIAFILFLVK